jgi:N-acyl-D-aspartate/D-glutamate deacylase
MWDPILAPSAWHGVTTVVMGNCAVGFAPVRPDARAFLLSVMEAVEEIPINVMEAGIDWDWESFPEYLDALDRRRHTIDIGTQVAHIALRGYVMGDRADRDEPATPDDIARMAELTKEALRAGALALSCSRTTAHKMPDGRIVPGANARADEVMALAEALGQVGNRVMQYLGNAADLENDLPYILDLARNSGSPIHFIMSDTGWQQRIATIEQGRREGLTLVGHVAPRAVGMISHWQAVTHPFRDCPGFIAIAGLPWEDQLARLQDADFRAQLVSEAKALPEGWFATNSLNNMFPMAEYPDYEPDPGADSVAAQAVKAGRDPVEFAYDAMLAGEGHGMIYVPIANYRAGDLSEVMGLLNHPGTVVSLADGGAHCTRVCDSAATTFMLAHWGRDRSRGETLPLPQIVKALSRDTASSYGLDDRGLIATGYLADINVIDFARLQLPGPYRAFDFPFGGQRLLQKAEGYVATIKRGQVTFRNGKHCGVYPGGVVRGPQQAVQRADIVAA